MAREYVWKDYGSDHAVLYGPEPYMIAAVITLDHGDPDLQESFWRVMSSDYRSLNLEEEDTSISLENMKRRTLISLGNELQQRKTELDADMSNLLDMLFREEMKRRM